MTVNEQSKELLHREFEADLEFTMFEISKKFKYQFTDIPGKPGFLRINIADVTGNRDGEFGNKKEGSGDHGLHDNCSKDLRKDDETGNCNNIKKTKIGNSQHNHPNGVAKINNAVGRFKNSINHVSKVVEEEEGKKEKKFW